MRDQCSCIEIHALEHSINKYRGHILTGQLLFKNGRGEWLAECGSPQCSTYSHEESEAFSTSGSLVAKYHALRLLTNPRLSPDGMPMPEQRSYAFTTESVSVISAWDAPTYPQAQRLSLAPTDGGGVSYQLPNPYPVCHTTPSRIFSKTCSCRVRRWTSHTCRRVQVTCLGVTLTALALMDWTR